MVMNRCLILGGAGFIGAHLVKRLVEKKITVRVFSKGSVKETQQLFSELDQSYIEIVNGDFTNDQDVYNALIGCASCIHLITTTLPASSNKDIKFDITSNLLGSINLLESANKLGMKKIIFLSSGGAVYGNPEYTPIDEIHKTDPLSSYGITKLAIEKYMHLFGRMYGLKPIILRVSNPYGPGQNANGVQGAIASFLKKAINGLPIEIWGDGSVVRDYIYIKDLVSAVDLSLSYEGNETLFNIGYGKGYSLNEILTNIELLLNKKLDVIYKPHRVFDIQTNILDVEKARVHLNWQPKTSLREGLLKYLDSDIFMS